MRKILVNPNFDLTPKSLFEILSEELGEELIIKYENFAKGDTVYITRKTPSDGLMIKIKRKTHRYLLRLYSYTLSDQKAQYNSLTGYALSSIGVGDEYHALKENVINVICNSKKLKAEY